MTRRGTARPSWSARDDLVVCVGGPRDGYWYTAADWHQSIDAAAHVAAKSGQPTPHVEYVATDARMPHPHDAATTGHVLTWQPAADTTAAAWRPVLEERHPRLRTRRPAGRRTTHRHKREHQPA